MFDFGIYSKEDGAKSYMHKRVVLGCGVYFHFNLKLELFFVGETPLLQILVRSNLV